MMTLSSGMRPLTKIQPGVGAPTILDRGEKRPCDASAEQMEEKNRV